MLVNQNKGFEEMSRIKWIKLWTKRNFSILSTEECKSLKLIPAFNIYGDTINLMNCRSIWKDEMGRLYRCKNLIN